MSSGLSCAQGSGSRRQQYAHVQQSWIAECSLENTIVFMAHSFSENVRLGPRVFLRERRALRSSESETSMGSREHKISVILDRYPLGWQKYPDKCFTKFAFAALAPDTDCTNWECAENKPFSASCEIFWASKYSGRPQFITSAR